MNDSGIVAAEEQDHSSDIFGLGPLAEIRIGHGFSIGFRIDGTRKDRIGPDARSLQIAGE